MSKIKVLQVCYSLKAAGIETFVTSIQKQINKKLVENHFLIYKATKVDLFYKDVIENNGGVIENSSADEVDNFLLRHIKQRLNYYSTLKKGNYDIVHVHASSGLQGIEVMLAHIAGVKKIVVHSHSSKMGRATKFNWLKKIIHIIGIRIINRFADATLACSEEAGAWLFPYSKSENIVFIHNGVECTEFAFDEGKRNRIRSKLGIEKEQRVFGHVGSFTESKNQSFIVEVFAEILKLNKDSQLLLIGDGPRQKSIKKKVSDMQLPNVRFMGIQRNCNELFMAMDGFIFPSFWEGLPIVIVEAQATGLPCVLSDTVTKQIDVCGLLKYMSLECTAKQWAEELYTIANSGDRSCYYQLVQKSSFDISTTARELEIIYLSLMK